MVNQEPKFVTTKKITELDKPLSRIALKLNFLIKNPIATANIREEYVKIIVLCKPITKSLINIALITINKLKIKFLK